MIYGFELYCFIFGKCLVFIAFGVIKLLKSWIVNEEMQTVDNQLTLN